MAPILRVENNSKSIKSTPSKQSKQLSKMMYKFSWNFTDASSTKYGKFACVASSVADARSQVLGEIVKITALHDQWVAACAVVDDEERQEALAAVSREINVDRDISPFALGVFDFTDKLHVMAFDSDEVMELGVFICRTEPVQTEFRAVSLFSCIDG